MAIAHSVGMRNFIAASGVSTAFGAGGSATGRINIYTGSKPSDPDAAATGTLLGTLAMAATTFSATITGGILTAGAIASDTSADASGTAGWFRMYLSADAVTASGNNITTSTATTFRRIDGTCGQGTGDISFDNAVFVAGGTIAITSLTLAVAA